MRRIAAWLDSYRAELREALERSAAHGFGQVHANAASGAFDEILQSASARRHLRKYLGDLGLQLGAVALDYPGRGLAEPGRAEQRLEQSRTVLALCAELRIPRAAVTVGGLGDPRTSPLAREALARIAELADHYGVETAVRDPLEPLEQVAIPLREIRCPALRLAVDSAEPDAVQAVSQSADLLGTLYLRDVRRSGATAEEVPYGQGDVDFPQLLAAAAATDRDPPLVLRCDALRGVDALRQGREYIASLLSRSDG